MRKNILILSLCIISVLASASGEVKLPDFSDYKSKLQHSGKLKSIDFESHEKAKTFKSILNGLVGLTPNFGGKFILTFWGCGSSCQQVAMVDATNGSVYFLDSAASNGICIEKDSDLLVVDPISQDLIDSYGGEIPIWVKTKYYKWDGDEFNLLVKSREKINFECSAI